MLSNVYWTLLVEVKFYVLVAIVMKMKIWKNYRYQILFVWNLLALLYSFTHKGEMIGLLLDLRFAGHFSLGILSYLFLIRKDTSPWMVPIVVMSVWSIFRNMLGYTSWIRSFYTLQYSDFDIFFGMLLILAFFIHSVSMISTVIPPKNLIFLGSLSFPLYLIHADFGYFIRTQYYKRIIVWFPTALSVVNEHMIMATEICMSFFIAWLFLKFSKSISKKIWSEK